MTMKSFIIIIASILTFMFPAIPASGSNGSRAVRLFSDPELITGLYTCFCLDKDGMLWIGSDTGLLRFDGNSYDVYRHDDNNPGSISDNRILKILCDSHGNLWVGTANGLNRYNPDTDTFSHITLPEKAFDGYIIGLIEQHDGTVTFLVSGVGLYVIDHSDDMPVAVRYLPNTIGERGFSILAKGSDKSLYLGCHNGSMCIISPNGNAEFRKISSDYITGIVVENDSSILISAVNDIYRYDPQTDRLTALTIDSHSKLPVNNITCGKDGTVYFGSDAGITSLRPSSVTTPDLNNCNVKVSALYVNGSRIFASSMSGDRPIIDGNPLSPSALHLSHKDNTLMMRLSTLDFRDASNVRYKWQIPQLGDTWTRTKPGENVITLPTLEPGNYTLRLKACENNISSDVTEIRIHIASPWYTSDIAKALYLLVLIAIIVLSFTVMKKKREEKINDAKIKFFMDISHDIRSPVTLILSPLESLLKQPLDPEVTAKLHTMRRNAHRLLSLVNQLLDLRKIEKGKMRLKCSPTDMRSFVGELVEMYESQAETKHISMEFKCDDELPKVSIDRDNFDKILVNLISNAIKYTPDGGNIQVRLCKADDDEIGKCAEIQVIDSGIGLDNKTLAHIFDRFYRARENHGNSASVGFGIGLDLCRRLVTLHGGTISAANRSDGTKGSVFTVRIPLYVQNTIENQAITIGGVIRTPKPTTTTNISPAPTFPTATLPRPPRAARCATRRPTVAFSWWTTMPNCVNTSKTISRASIVSRQHPTEPRP